MEHAHTPWTHPACLEEGALLSQCELGRGRTGGPGGQHRNKVETEVRITHLSTGIRVKAGERRSLAENRKMAVRRLRLALAVQVRSAVPIGEIGSALWASRRSADGKIACNPDHHDYPMLLAEAIDVLAAARWDAGRAGLRLGVTATQLVRLVREHPPAMARLNAERALVGLHPLR